MFAIGGEYDVTSTLVHTLSYTAAIYLIHEDNM